MPTCDPALVAQLCEVISANGLTQSAVAKQMGMSAPRLSNVLKGIYDVEDIAPTEHIIRTWLDKYVKRSEYKPLTVDFVETTASRHIDEIAESCRIYKELGVCVGDAGVGKTTAVRRYADQHSDVVLVFSNHSMTQHSLMMRLADGLGIDTKGSTGTLFDRCADRLHQGDFCVIIDEAEHLKPCMLDDLRRLADPEVGGCGMLFVGLDSFRVMVQSRRSEFAYLNSRIHHQYHAKELSDAGVAAFCAAAGARFVPFAKSFAKRTHNPRILIHLFNMCHRICFSTEQQTGEPCPLGEDVIETAVKQLVF